MHRQKGPTVRVPTLSDEMATSLYPLSRIYVTHPETPGACFKIGGSVDYRSKVFREALCELVG